MVEDKIKEIINNIKPILYEDGGLIEFVKYEDNIVYISLGGTCYGCGYLDYTLEGIEFAIKSEIPEVLGVQISS